MSHIWRHCEPTCNLPSLSAFQSRERHSPLSVPLGSPKGRWVFLGWPLRTWSIDETTLTFWCCVVTSFYAAAQQVCVSLIDIMLSLRVFLLPKKKKKDWKLYPYPTILIKQRLCVCVWGGDTLGIECFSLCIIVGTITMNTSNIKLQAICNKGTRAMLVGRIESISLALF